MLDVLLFPLKIFLVPLGAIVSLINPLGLPGWIDTAIKWIANVPAMIAGWFGG